MARRTVNRRELRDVAESAERDGKSDSDGKASTATKTRTTRASRTTRMCRMKAVWDVYDASAKKVASFDYPAKAEAEKLAKKLTSKKGSTHFVRQAKEPMADASGE